MMGSSPLPRMSLLVFFLSLFIFLRYTFHDLMAICFFNPETWGGDCKTQTSCSRSCMCPLKFCTWWNCPSSYELWYSLGSVLMLCLCVYLWITVSYMEFVRSSWWIWPNLHPKHRAHWSEPSPFNSISVYGLSGSEVGIDLIFFNHS
mgnify:CR=1 FL=1